MLNKKRKIKFGDTEVFENDGLISLFVNIKNAPSLLYENSRKLYFNQIVLQIIINESKKFSFHRVSKLKNQGWGSSMAGNLFIKRGGSVNVE